MTTAIQLWTVQLAKWRLVRELGITLLDITAKSGNASFAPRYEDVMNWKHHKLNWEEYEEIYRQRMYQSRRDNPDEWAKLKTLSDKLALACYCKPTDKCHRFIFREILTDYLKDAHLDVSYRGEITNYLPPQPQDTELEKVCT